jgi:hypothetical protein
MRLSKSKIKSETCSMASWAASLIVITFLTRPPGARQEVVKKQDKNENLQYENWLIVRRGTLDARNEACINSSYKENAVYVSSL